MDENGIDLLWLEDDLADTLVESFTSFLSDEERDLVTNMIRSICPQVHNNLLMIENAPIEESEGYLESTGLFLFISLCGMFDRRNGYDFADRLVSDDDYLMLFKERQEINWILFAKKRMRSIGWVAC